jgi:hypothetical protein
MHTYDFLPTLSSHEDAASFYHAVLPFYEAAAKRLSEHANPVEIYSTTNPFILGLFLSMVSSFSVFVVSSVTGNWSWYLSIYRQAHFAG